MKRWSFLFIAAIIVIGSSGSKKFYPGSLYWLQFRGPNASGTAPENANPPIHFNADSKLLWKTPVLAGWSSPCIVYDRMCLSLAGSGDRPITDIEWKINEDSPKHHPL